MALRILRKFLVKPRNPIRYASPEGSKITTAGIMVIGDEVLKGEIQDTNSNYLAIELHTSMGIRLQKISVIGDNVDEVSREIQYFSSSYDYVLTTGGIGPTHDDITYEAVAKAFNEKLILNTELRDICLKYYGTTDVNCPGMKMAYNEIDVQPNAEEVILGSNFQEVSSSTDSNDDEVLPQNINTQTAEWGNCIGHQLRFEPTYKGGVDPLYAAALVGSDPFIFLRTFIDNEVVDIMVEQTNLYATQVLCSKDDVAEFSVLRKWQPTTRAEMIRFIGLVGYMGLVRMPSIRHYWSTKRLFRNDVASGVMSRNRFETLLQLWHFSDNMTCLPGDRLYKIQPLIDLLVSKFQKVFTPEETFCIDESVIPFRGRLVFKQYLPKKTHKYGIKVFKLCSSDGYTWALKLYSGKEQDAKASVPTKVVLTLAEKLLGHGRTAITDNYYTSLALANQLLDKKTHLVGTLRSNRKGNPKAVITKKLKRNDIIAQENARGITVMKWRDKRDVLVLTTKHTDQMEEVRIRGEIKYKPKAILDYNKGKGSVDMSDQMSSYSTALRKTIKWYRKVAIEMVLGTALVNAHFLYKAINDKNISINDFREQIYEKMIEYTDIQENIDPEVPEATNQVGRKRKSKSTHQFSKKDGPCHQTRKYCRGCYANKVKGDITKNQVKKVNTFCSDCDDQPHFCLPCFNSNHQ